MLGPARSPLRHFHPDCCSAPTAFSLPQTGGRRSLCLVMAGARRCTKRPLAGAGRCCGHTPCLSSMSTVGSGSRARTKHAVDHRLRPCWLVFGPLSRRFMSCRTPFRLCSLTYVVEAVHNMSSLLSELFVDERACEQKGVCLAACLVTFGWFQSERKSRAIRPGGTLPFSRMSLVWGPRDTFLQCLVSTHVGV